jgi:primosomal protein N'
MYLVSVIPVIKGISKDSLSYLSATYFESGVILKCPIQKRMVDCVVLESKNIKEAKQEIRSAQYGLKKIEIHPSQLKSLHPEYMRAVMSTANHYGLPYSDVCELLLPKVLFESDYSFDIFPPHEDTQSSHISSVEQSNDEALLYYLAEIVENINRTIFIVAPNTHRAKQIYTYIKTQVKTGVYSLHSKISNKKQLETIQAVHASAHFVCICTTQYLSLIRENSLIYIDQSQSEQYLSVIEPRIHYTSFILECAQKTNSQCVMSDILLLGEVTPPHKYTKPQIVDMTESISGTSYIWQSSRLKEIIAEPNNKKILLYVPRRGLSTETYCGDCSKLLTCSCGSPLVLTTKNSTQRYYECLACRESYEMTDSHVVTCRTCGSWNLKQLGIGTELVVNELRDSGHIVIHTDSHFTKSARAIQHAVDEFENSERAVLVTTDISFEYLTQKVDVAVVVTLDSLLLRPHFNTDYTILRKILTVATLSKQRIVLQTRIPKHAVFQIITDSSLNKWKSEYISELEQSKLPPYGIVLQLKKVGRLTEKEKAVITYFCNEGDMQIDSYRAYTVVTIYYDKLLWQKKSVFILYELRKILTKSFSVSIE